MHREHIQFEATKCETSKITPNNHQQTSYHEKETTFSKNFLRWNLQKIFHPLEQTMMIQGKHAKQSAVFEAGLIVLKHYMDLNLRNKGSFVWYFIVHLLCFLSQLKNTLKQIPTYIHSYIFK